MAKLKIAEQEQTNQSELIFMILLPCLLLQNSIRETPSPIQLAPMAGLVTKALARTEVASNTQKKVVLHDYATSLKKNGMLIHSSYSFS